MRTIIVLTAAALLSFAACGIAQAKDQAAASQPAVRHAPMGILAKLNLTDDQKAQVKAIMQQARSDAKAATDKEAKKAIRKAAWEKIRTTVLTDAQRQQLEQMKAKHQANAAATPAATAPTGTK